MGEQCIPSNNIRNAYLWLKNGILVFCQKYHELSKAGVKSYFLMFLSVFFLLHTCQMSSLEVARVNPLAH
jgi:hypothetical protein